MEAWISAMNAIRCPSGDHVGWWTWNGSRTAPLPSGFMVTVPTAILRPLGDHAARSLPVDVPPTERRSVPVAFVVTKTGGGLIEVGDPAVDCHDHAPTRAMPVSRRNGQVVVLGPIDPGRGPLMIRRATRPCGWARPAGER